MKVIKKKQTVKWKSIKEKFPEKDGKYLVCNSSGEVWVADFAIDIHKVFDIESLPEWNPNIEEPGPHFYVYENNVVYGGFEYGNSIDCQGIECYRETELYSCNAAIEYWMPLPKPPFIVSF